MNNTSVSKSIGKPLVNKIESVIVKLNVMLILVLILYSLKNNYISKQVCRSWYSYAERTYSYGLVSLYAPMGVCEGVWYE